LYLVHTEIHDQESNQESIQQTQLNKTISIQLDMKMEEYIFFLSHIMSLQNIIIEKDMNGCEINNGILAQNYQFIKFSTDKF
jgi:hypothetical protein